MPLINPELTVGQKSLYVLLSPHGWADITEFADGAHGLLAVRMRLRCEVPLSTATEVRAYLLDRAEKALAALKEAGYLIYDSEVTLKATRYVEGELRVE